MKKIIALTLSAIVLMCCLAGCGAKRDPKYYGKWEATRLEASGESIDNFMGIPVGAIFRFEINEDGKVVWNSAVDNSVIQNANNDLDIRWKETEENRIQFKVTDLSGKPDTQTMEFVYRDRELVVEENDSAIYLSKVDEFTEIDTDLLNIAASAIQNFGITQ